MACLGVVLAGSAFGPLFQIGLAFLAVFAGLCLADWWLAPGPVDWEVHRIHSPALALGAENQVRIQLRARLRRPSRVEVRDETPPDILCHPVIQVVSLETGVQNTVSYRARPRTRGRHRFGRIVVRAEGPFRLWKRASAVAAEEDIPVYPALAAIGRWEGLVRRGALQEMGVRSWRRFGEGTEFAGVRDYIHGDDVRQINWPATARMVRPMTSEREPERSRPVWLVLDCGRLMAGGSEEITKLDAAMSAALLLAWVALFRGDRVGALAVAGDLTASIAMRAGRSHYPRLLDGLYSLHPELVDPDWELVVTQLRRRQGPRALVVIFTDLSDSRVAQQVASAAAALRPRHLPLVVTQQDSALKAASVLRPVDDLSMYRRAAALSVLEERERALQNLRRLGVLTVDSGPEGISPSVLNRYLELKGRGLL